MQLSKWIRGGGGRGCLQYYDRDMSDNTGDSDNRRFFPYYSDIILTLQIVEI